MPSFPATKRTVTRNNIKYSVWDEYPHRDENPQVEDWDFWSVFETRSWEADIEDTLSAHLTPTTTFLDIGAWWGPVSLIAARLAGHVHAVEPDPVARERLDANVGRQRRKNITVHPYAIAVFDGTVRIGHRADRRFGDSMTSTIFDGDAIQVPAVTLETLITENDLGNIGLIKMDIEGGEEQVLPACVDTILQLGAPLLLSVHTALVVDPDQYLAAIRISLGGFNTTLLSGQWEGLGTILAVPR